MQWEIYDAYVEELQKQEKNKDKQKAVPSRKDNDKSKKKTMQVETQVNFMLFESIFVLAQSPNMNAVKHTLPCVALQHIENIISYVCLPFLSFRMMTSPK